MPKKELVAVELTDGCDVENIPEGYDENCELTREEFEKLYHTKGKRLIFKTPEGEEVRVGGWIYVDFPEYKREIESEPDIIEALYKTYYGEVYVVVRIGMRGKHLGKKREFKLDEFKKLIHTKKIVLLRMPEFQYGDRFVNKYNREELTIRDIPRSINQVEKDFVYYVRTYSVTKGHNYRAMTEKEIKEFYYTAGAIKKWEGYRTWK